MNASNRHRLIIADDHPLFRRALRELAGGITGVTVIAEVGSFDDVLRLLDRDPEVDLALLDLGMPGVRGLSALMHLRTQHPAVPLAIVSANDDSSVIRRCIEFGARGFLPKTLGVDQMRKAIERVLKGDIWTPPGFASHRQFQRPPGPDAGAAFLADAATDAGADDALGRAAQQADRL